MLQFDVAVIGAGAAGMMCAAVAAQRGRSVVLIDHAKVLAEKIRISGGGRCNFTNKQVGPENFISANPHFCKSALAGYSPQDFIELMRRHGIAWHEKHKGQLFCDKSSEDIIEMLRVECEQGGVQWRMPCEVKEILRTERPGATGFSVHTSVGTIEASRLVVATGGLAIPQLGATDFGLKIARQFGLKVIEPRPALVPLTFDVEAWAPFGALAGVALQALVRAGPGRRAQEFLEDVLFTHRGLSGPGILQISSYWQPGEAIELNLAPGQDLSQKLVQAKVGGKQQLGTLLSSLWPKRLAEQWLGEQATLRLADAPDRVLKDLAQRIHGWSLIPTGTAGYKKAEVMRGGVDTRGLDQRSMEARSVPGLHFIGETVDVTGWLGGYNFQWAWASAVACARSM
ncbi:NAD(P)/FAD-dependent oxidoreductase [Zwartia vadi]|uniref:NAD(P)/FAD-dependent oxidoreductase n=1 Tax=Zwartia vadi TaxID=3058168 RepID=UPI0025B587A0|nr:NAD(P)/FAD-dependent oxidoreductase [Zwartia vadi]MDN3988501.1 NAD(P)/FAD-dependent oxidoreductase [Zwartia vadi]